MSTFKKVVKTPRNTGTWLGEEKVGTKWTVNKMNWKLIKDMDDTDIQDMLENTAFNESAPDGENTTWTEDS